MTNKDKFKDIKCIKLLTIDVKINSLYIYVILIFLTASVAFPDFS